MSEEKIREIQERREKRKEAIKNAELEQYASDLEAIEELEIKLGRVATIKVAFVEGQPTRAAIRTPTRQEYQRYRDLLTRANANTNANAKAKAITEAQDQLAKAVWVYPEKREEQEKMVESSPGLLPAIVIAAGRLADGRDEDEGKD